MPIIELTNDELSMLQDALDSHTYWELSDRDHRSSGYVLEPGSEDPDAVAAIAACDALLSKLERAAGEVDLQIRSIQIGKSSDRQIVK